LHEKSLSTQLSEDEVRLYLFAIKNDPRLIVDHSLTVNQVISWSWLTVSCPLLDRYLSLLQTSQLLIHNWALVVEVAVQLQQLSQQDPVVEQNNGSGRVASPLMLYLSNFLLIEITTLSLETIHAICKRVDLPLEFLQKFLLQCMEFCSKTKDTSVQVRIAGCLLFEFIFCS
jgi:hypothetical protein